MKGGGRGGLWKDICEAALMVLLFENWPIVFLVGLFKKCIFGGSIVFLWVRENYFYLWRGRLYFFGPIVIFVDPKLLLYF